LINPCIIWIGGIVYIDYWQAFVPQIPFENGSDLSKGKHFEHQSIVV